MDWTVFIQKTYQINQAKIQNETTCPHTFSLVGERHKMRHEKTKNGQSIKISMVKLNWI